MPIPVTAEVEFTLTIILTGSYQPYVPATGPSYSSGGDPPSGDYTEDVAIADIEVQVPAGYIDGRPTWATHSLLKDLDTANPAIQQLLARILSTIDEDAQMALREEADVDYGPDDDDRDDRMFDADSDEA